MKAIIFDCFGVFYLDSGQHFYETYVQQYEMLRPELTQLGRQVDYGFISQKDFEASVAELTGLPHSLIAEHIQGTHKRNNGLLNYAQSLRPEYKIGLLSNIGPQSMNTYFSLSERSRFFDATVLSGEEGIAKPHPAIYKVIAERLGISPGECVMVDDSEDNCAGADAAGMKPILFVSNEQVMRDLGKTLG